MVFERLGIAVGNLREPDPHAGPLIQPPTSCRPGGEFRPQTDLYAQFFPEFPVQRGLAFLTGVHFPAGKFPEPSELLGSSPPGHQHAGRVRQRVHYCSANYLYQSTHRPSL